MIAIGPNNQLNQRSEILQRCRHKDCLVLSNNYKRCSIRRQERRQNHFGTVSTESLNNMIPGRPPEEELNNNLEEEPRVFERPTRPGTAVDYSRYF